MSCLIAGYCRLFVDPSLNIFPWEDDTKKHRVSAEEGVNTKTSSGRNITPNLILNQKSSSFWFAGYVSRCGSDSDSSSDMEPPVNWASQDEKACPRVRSSSDPDGRKRKDKDRRRHGDDKDKGDKSCGDKKEEKDSGTEKDNCPLKSREDKSEDTEKKEDACGGGEGQQIHVEVSNSNPNEKEEPGVKTGGGEEVKAGEEQPSVSSDSCRSDSRVLFSPSSDSLDALEEDDLISCSSSSVHPRAPRCHSPLQLHPYSQSQIQPHLLAPPPAHSHPLIQLLPHDKAGEGLRRSGDGADPQLLSPASPSPSPPCLQRCSGTPCTDDSSLCFAELSRLVDFLPSPPEASEEDEDIEEELRRRKELLKEMEESMMRAGEGGGVSGEASCRAMSPSPSSADFVFNFDHGDARCYYSLCTNITPDSARGLPHALHHEEVKKEMDNEQEPIPILHPPPGFGDSSSDEEFFDARDRFASPEDPTSGAKPRGDFLLFVKLFSCNLGSIKSTGIMKAQKVNSILGATYW